MGKMSYDDDDYMDDSEDSVKPFFLYENLVPQRVMSFYLSGPIGEPHRYVDMIHRIKVASPGDTIYIYLNTPGGNISTGVQLINAMEATPARVITVLEAEAHSLGTLIFLSGDEYIINDNCRMMFHNFSSGLFGKGNELEMHLQSTVKWFNKLCEQIYIPFLSDDELSRMQKGEDLWFDSDEIRGRLQEIADAYEEERARELAAKGRRKTDKPQQEVKKKTASKKKSSSRKKAE